METKPLLYGLIGFFIGGLIVSVAADMGKSKVTSTPDNTMTTSMQASTDSLKSKTGDDFDAAFISEMIAHHQGAIDMAKLSEQNAKHDEIKQLSRDIIMAQESEIAEMKRWQSEWRYESKTQEHGGH